MYDIWTMALFGRLLATSAVIRSKPSDLFRELYCMEYLISFGVNGLTGKETGSGELRNSLTVLKWASSLILERGWNVSDKWSLKRSAFSESEHAKLPSDFLIGRFGAL